MYDWLIACPAWGDRCVPLFIDTVLPAIRLAAAGATGRIRFLVHTDRPNEIALALSRFEHEIRPVPDLLGYKPTSHYQFGIANKEAMADARNGEAVAFINADMVPSLEVFFAAENAFERGKKLVVMAATRTIGKRAPPGCRSRDLLLWAMQHRHPTVIDNFYGAGSSSIPWALYFSDGTNVVMHGFHLHPFAYIKDRDISFKGVTTDSSYGLIPAFRRSEIHVVTRADEAAFAEMSPPDRCFSSLPRRMNVKTVSLWASKHATADHCWLFSHPISIVGEGRDLGDREVCNKVLSRIERIGGPLK